MIMWIILGVLAAVVLGVIITMSVLDRKKAKKEYAKKISFTKDVNESRLKIAEKVLIVFKKNELNLKKFVPSVGRLKMSDIKNEARHALSDIELSKFYKLAKEDSKNNQDLFENFSALKQINSNLWSSKGQNHIDFFKNLKTSEKTLLAEKAKSNSEKKKVGFFKSVFCKKKS